MLYLGMETDQEASKYPRKGEFCNFPACLGKQNAAFFFNLRNLLGGLEDHFIKPPVMHNLWLYGCFLKWWYPQIIHFNRVFHDKPSILGYPYFRKHPYGNWRTFLAAPRFVSWNTNGTSKPQGVLTWSILAWKAPISHFMSLLGPRFWTHFES